LTLTFCTCMSLDHSSHGIEGKGQRRRLGLGLGCQFETRSVGSRSSIEDTFLVLIRACIHSVMTQNPAKRKQIAWHNNDFHRQQNSQFSLGQTYTQICVGAVIIQASSQRVQLNCVAGRHVMMVCSIDQCPNSIDSICCGFVVQTAVHVQRIDVMEFGHQASRWQNSDVVKSPSVAILKKRTPHHKLG